MSKWVGYAVSVNCGEPLGCYQGTILDADGSTITLTKAFRNGFPYPKSQVTLNAADIKELKIIEARAEPTEQTHSTVAVSKQSKRAPRATVCENLQANPSSSGNQSHNNSSNSNKQSSARNNQAPARSKPIDIQGQRNNKNNNHAGSYGVGGSTPKARGGNMRRRDEACFGDAAEPGFDRDFDFEGNLALFDKRALWEQMNNQKPDLVRQTDEVGKFRHDENVLGGGGPTSGAKRAILVPSALRGPIDYVTDDGLLVPSLTPQARQQLWAALERHHLASCARTLLARAAADVCIRVLGGGRRLEPRNAHQTPLVAVLAGAHHTGGAALQAARLLKASGAAVTAYLHPPSAAESSSNSSLSREVAALSLSEVPLVTSVQQLPRPDLLLLAVHDPQQPQHTTRYESVISWAVSAVSGAGARAAGVVVEGGEGGAWRAAVAALLPGGEVGAARLYLADVGAPVRLFNELGIRYRPPFGATPLLALHPRED